MTKLVVIFRIFLRRLKFTGENAIYFGYKYITFVIYSSCCIFLCYKQAPRFRNATQNAIQLLKDLIGIK